jgi:hypothetical protein
LDKNFIGRCHVLPDRDRKLCRVEGERRAFIVFIIPSLFAFFSLGYLEVLSRSHCPWEMLNIHHFLQELFICWGLLPGLKEELNPIM